MIDFIIAFALTVLLCLVAGYFTGWVAEYFFPSIFVPIIKWTGLESGAQVGALLGFVGSFFRATVSIKSA